MSHLGSFALHQESAADNLLPPTTSPLGACTPTPLTPEALQPTPRHRVQTEVKTAPIFWELTADRWHTPWLQMSASLQDLENMEGTSNRPAPLDPVALRTQR